jgi:hypothetical protein
MARLVGRKRTLSSFGPALLLLAQLSWTGPAPAQPAADDNAGEAGRLFQNGLRAMLDGQYAVGCPRLAESYQREPLPGVLFTLAECEANWKKLASALAHYQTFASALTSMTAERRATFEERRRVAAGQIAALSVAVPELTVSVPADAPPNLQVKAGDILLPAASYGVGRRMDPGYYAVSAEIDGQRIWEHTVLLEPGDRAHLEIQLPPSRRLDGLPLDPQPRSAEAGPGSRGPHTTVYIAGGFAVAGFTTGLISGALAYSHAGTVNRNCPDSTCNPNGRAALDAARSEARVSTIAFSLGGVGAAAAVLLLLLEPRSAAPSNARPTHARSSWSIASAGSTLTLESRF